MEIDKVQLLILTIMVDSGADSPGTGMTLLYNCLSKKGLSNGTIRNLNNNVLSPTFQLAVDDDDLRKNPCKGCLKEYPYNPLGKRESHTIEEQENFIECIRNDKVYSKYLPIILLILGTALRRGEVLGLTWKDIDLKNKTIKIDHQLYYHKVDGVYRFGICPPKSESGNRTIPLTKEMIALLQEIKRKEYFNGMNAKVTVDGITDFVFLNNQKNNVLIPRQFGDSLTAACNKYNNREEKLAERENRGPILLPIYAK